MRLKCDGTRAETRFRLSAKRTSPFSHLVVSLVDYWQASCAHQPAGVLLLVQACVLQSCDAYWLPTPFSCFPFTSPPVRHRVPSHFKRGLPAFIFRGQEVQPDLMSLEDVDTTFMRNGGNHSPNDKVSYSRRYRSSGTRPWEPYISHRL